MTQKHKNRQLPPKISIIVKSFPTTSETFISLQIAELYNRGFDINVINLDKPGDIKWAPDLLKPVIRSISMTSSKYFHSDTPYFRIFYLLPAFLFNTLRHPVPSLRLFINAVLKRNFYDFKRIQNDAYLLRAANSADIIHCQYATLADRLCDLKKYGFENHKAKLTCSIRGYDITIKYYQEAIDWKALFRHFDLFLPVCHFFIPILQQMGCEKKIKVVHSPVNTTILNPIKQCYTKTKKTVKIISVGRLVEKKGLDDAINGIYLLHQKMANIHYTIIGEGQLHDYLNTKIQKYKLTNIITLLGALPSSQTLKIMADADILLAPSKTASDGNSEGIPNVVKEGMLLGLQVVATWHAGIPEIIEHGETGFLVPEGNPEKIAAVLHELINDRTGWDKRAQKARAFASHMFSVEKTTDELIEAYNQILNIEFSR